MRMVRRKNLSSKCFICSKLLLAMADPERPIFFIYFVVFMLTCCIHLDILITSNKRGEKMKKQSISALLAQVMYLANEANEKTDKCVFIRFSGHVSGLSIEVARDKEHYNNYIAEAYIYPNSGGCDMHLKNIVRNLQYLVDHGELDTDRLTEVPVTTYQYHM